MNSPGTISSIDVQDPSTWQRQVLITFDLDWAADEVIEDSIDLVEEAGISATWFITHDTPLIARLRSNPRFEIGIHPNFNFLLSGDRRNGANANEVIERVLRLAPEAKAVRSHSMTQSSELLDLFSRHGLTHDVNHFIPSHLYMPLRPWRLWNGMTRVPYCWEDDISCMHQRSAQPERHVCDLINDTNGLFVVDFHPIHVFLNTESLERYENTRQWHRTPERLAQHRFGGYGTRDQLIELLEALSRTGIDK